jgi:hypothetical protein
MRRMSRCARLKAVPPPNTSRNGAVPAAPIVAIALTTYQSFSTRAGLGNAKSFCASSKSWRDGLSLKHQLQVAVTEPPRETSLHPHHRIDWHLSGAAFVVGAFRIGRFPGDSQLGERLPGGAEESVRAVEQRLSGEARDDGAAVDSVAKPHQALFPYQGAERAEHLILTAEIAEFPRQEYVAALPGDPLLDF